MYTELASRFPACPDVLSNLGTVHMLDSDNDNATACFQKVRWGIFR